MMHFWNAQTGVTLFLKFRENYIQFSTAVTVGATAS